MNSFNNQRGLLVRAVSYVFVCAIMAAGAWAQDVTSSTVQHGPASFETQVRNAEVVYVEGNDLVIKVENGRVEHMVVPDTDKFHIDGRETSVYDLKPGMKLTETITTATTPRYVNTVRIIEGKVWHVNAPKTVIVRLPDHKHILYEVPSHAKFTIDGEEKTVFDLRKGMQFKATIITDEPETVIERTKHVVAQAPPTPETPQEVGTLLFAPPVATEPVATEIAEELPQELPSTGSLLPLIGLVGLLAIATSLGLRTVRRLRA